MNDRIEKMISGNTAETRHNPLFGRKGWSYFRGFLLILLLILFLPLSSVSENLSCRRLPMVMDGFLANHYAIKTITPEVKTHAIEQMIKGLDPSKTMLYSSDVERLKPILYGLFASMQRGDCAALRPVYDVLVARARENEDLVRKILGPDYRLDETAELMINVNKRSYVKTKAEKRELLRKIVQFRIENTLQAGIDLAEARKQQIHHYELQTRRVVERNPEKLLTNAAEAFALALDPHTSYLSPERFEDLQISMQLSLEGIGAILSSDNGFTVIEELTAGGSASRSGQLKPKDKIIAVAQEGERPVNVIDMDLHDVIKMIRGRKGTRVTLTILRQEERTSRFNATITRDKVELKEQEARIEYVTRKAGGREYTFGVIDLPSFYGDEKEKKSCSEDVKSLLAEARQRHVDGIVLDLSRNGGGLLKEAVRLSGLFVHKGGIVATRDGLGQVTVLANGPAVVGPTSHKNKWMSLPEEDPRALYMGPLVVLTSRMSASASEIVAGALKDYARAVIVGSDHTFGKGSVQVMMPLPWNLGGMTVTTGMFFLPGGRSTQKTGVEADLKLPIWSTLEDVGETALDYPLPAQAIPPFLGVPGNGAPLWKPLKQSLLAELAARSKARVAKEPKFAEIIKGNREAAARKGIIRLADLRKDMAKENGIKKKETYTELKQKAREQYAPFVDESVNVLLDMVTMGYAYSPRS
ncbi:C-terminal processing peptidase-1. Serine peptidase. MEROPS family S41A [Syntrophus gentianae]|uniref:C-terminal processing peptidase-1. Serine peptidase. MEROPS family S41A n=1 Tax=Syntrophus gentianae TaxID=43775 RepID=A0A1H7WMY4_9BACT|nr:S41 family peptidase [Syntrophus gentianae]SEM22505.1 C-terminal processing peptidase-1. Serine peptidase. MEROPS family S41A [Syntrophus gentianae]